MNAERAHADMRHRLRSLYERQCIDGATFDTRLRNFAVIKIQVALYSGCRYGQAPNGGRSIEKIATTM
jgi:hypothetical protein